MRRAEYIGTAECPWCWRTVPVYVPSTEPDYGNPDAERVLFKSHPGSDQRGRKRRDGLPCVGSGRTTTRWSPKTRVPL